VRRVALIGCSKEKLDHAAPARELYTGQLFRAARAYAEATCDEWLILSAKHGLVGPDTVLEPYDTTLAELGAVGRSKWGRDVAIELRKRFILTDTTFVFLAGAPYVNAVLKADRELAFERPLQGLGIGHQKEWLAKALDEAQTAKRSPVQSAMRELRGAGVIVDAPAGELDATVGRVRVRCAAAVARDPDNCLVGTDAAPLEPGDLLVEESDGEEWHEWHGGVIVRAADRARVAGLLVTHWPPKAST